MWLKKYRLPLNKLGVVRASNTILPQASTHGHYSSTSTKNWGWMLARRQSLNGSTIPMQGPILTVNWSYRARGYPTPSIFSRPGSGESCIVDKWMDKRVTSLPCLDLHGLWLAVAQTFSCKHDSDKARHRCVGICSCFTPSSIYTLMFGSMCPSSVGMKVYYTITKSKLVICSLVVDDHFKR